MRFLQDLLADLTGEKDRDHPPAPGAEDMRRAFRHISALEGDLVRLLLSSAATLAQRGGEPSA